MAKEVRGVNDKDSAEQEGNSSFSISNNGFLIDHLGITGRLRLALPHYILGSPNYKRWRCYRERPHLPAYSVLFAWYLIRCFAASLYANFFLLVKGQQQGLEPHESRFWGIRLCFNGIHDFHKQCRFLPNCNCFLGCSGFIRSFSYAAMAAAAKG